MKTSTVMMALVVGLAMPAVTEAQSLFRREGTPKPRTVPTPATIPARPAAPAPAPTAAPGGTRDNRVLQANAVIPEPVNPGDLPPPTIPLPPEPVDPYLLTKECGPFMVLAYTFKGPNAEKYAQALAMELRITARLPAYVLRTKDFPGRSNIHGVPPVAAPNVRQPNIGFPEKLRTEDEAAVLVGNEKTLDDSEKLLKQVKKLKPVCLDGIPEPMIWRKGRGLSRATRTTNPYIPAEQIFQHKADVMVRQMNQGPHTIYNCPGRYSLQIAEFTGRSAFVDQNGGDRKNTSLLDLRKSPLATAADSAEKLADSLARDQEVRQTGYMPYVFHDRVSSKVMMGSFNAPNDPAALKLRDRMLRMAGDLNNRKTSETMIVPALGLTDLEKIKASR